jgi:hypothetical protein
MLAHVFGLCVLCMVVYFPYSRALAKGMPWPGTYVRPQLPPGAADGLFPGHGCALVTESLQALFQSLQGQGRTVDAPCYCPILLWVQCVLCVVLHFPLVVATSAQPYYAFAAGSTTSEVHESTGGGEGFWSFPFLVDPDTKIPRARLAGHGGSALHALRSYARSFAAVGGPLMCHGGWYVPAKNARLIDGHGHGHGHGK